MTQGIRLIKASDGVRLIGAAREGLDLAVPRKASDGVWHSYVDGVEKLWIEKSGSRVIEGIASTGAMSSHGQVLNPRGCIVRFPIPLLFGHGFRKGTREYAYKRLEEARIGEITMVHKQPHAVLVRAVIDDSLAGDAAWEKIVCGEARCFSVGPANGKLKGIVDGDKFFDEWTLKEVSVCFQGANPDCVFEVLTA